MSESKKLITKKFDYITAKNFIESVNNNSYYVFTAKHTPYSPDDESIEQPADGLYNSTIKIYDDMIFGKRVQESDVKYMITRYDWEENVKFDMYDHEDTTLYSKKYYATVNAGSQYHTYKCLYNNNGANSTVEPYGTDINPFETPEDGYIWKYMFTVDSTTVNKFATTDYFPLVVNNSVVANATVGSIEVIDIIDGGSGYNNYFVGEFRSEDIRIGGNELVYGLLETAASHDNYYQGCVIKITSGNAADEYRYISDYSIDSGQKRIFIDKPFTNNPSATDTYEIYPYVHIFDHGGSTINCVARAIISSNTGNSVSKVEILNPGKNYRSADAVLLPTPIVNVEANAELRAIISPTGGHGSNPHVELNANKIGISVKFTQSEGGYITTENDYRTIGIIKNPQFTNVVVQYVESNTIGNFSVGETIYQYKDIKLQGNVTISSGSSTIIGNGTNFSTLRVGDEVIISDGYNNTFASLLTIANNTQITINATPNWSGSGTSISLIEKTRFGNVSAKSYGSITMTDVTVGGIDTSILNIFGEETFTTSLIDDGALLPISVNGKAPNNFFTFSQLETLIGSLTSGSGFEEDERIYQESLITYLQPEAKFHSFVEGGGSDVIYATNSKNVFDLNTNIIGENSDSVFFLLNKYSGDLVKDSGDIIYIENVDPITRESNKSETIKLILNF